MVPTREFSPARSIITDKLYAYTTVNNSRRVVSKASTTSNRTYPHVYYFEASRWIQSIAYFTDDIHTWHCVIRRLVHPRFRHSKCKQARHECLFVQYNIVFESSAQEPRISCLASSCFDFHNNMIIDIALVSVVLMQRALLYTCRMRLFPFFTTHQSFSRVSCSSLS